MAQPLKERFSGRIIMAGINGVTPDHDTAMLIKEFGVCNFIIFNRNVNEGPERLLELTSEIRVMCSKEGLPEPLFAVDQEGGKVQRLNSPFWHHISSNRSAASAQNPEEAVRLQAESAAEMLKEAGIDLNLAPVLDLSGPADNGVLMERTYSDLPAVTSDLGMIYIESLQAMGVGATAKHFPGIGMVRQDPHEKRPVVDADQDRIMEDAMPFMKAVSSGVAAMMTSHVVYRGIDTENPATFSFKISTELLRNRFGFKGVLITDDLEMGGIIGYDTIGNAATKALNAGHDMILVCHETERVVEAVTAIDEGVKKGLIQEDRLLEADARVDVLRKWRSV